MPTAGDGAGATKGEGRHCAKTSGTWLEVTTDEGQLTAHDDSIVSQMICAHTLELFTRRQLLTMRTDLI